MRLAIVGGALQGMEAVYLSKKAGYETIVIDKRKDAPAISLSDEHVVLDPVKDKDAAKKIFNGCDKILPACEDIELLRVLDDMLSSSGKLLFDMDSYNISSSKTVSNKIMAEAGVPIPKDWPECGYPAIVKPSSQSGSIGVSVAYNDKDVKNGIEKIKEMGDEPVVQEFVSGKSVSIEVIGNKNTFRSFVTTEVMLSGNYDCKRVRCSPEILEPKKEKEFKEIGETIAERIRLGALMDVEAIDTKKGLRVLEIDARIPSQTPAAVLAATGVNLIGELTGRSSGIPKKRVSSYEHFIVTKGKLMTCGEKEFSHVSSPRIECGLFGSDEMITDYNSDKETWRGTMINSARNDREMEKKRAECIGKIMVECNLKEFIDATPEMI